jgi:phasin family protein
MQETERMAEEAKRIGHEAQEQAKRVGQEYQNAVEGGFEAATRSFGEINRGAQAIAAEMTGYSKKTLEDVFQAWEQLLRARSFGDVVDIQTRYAKNAYDTHISEMSRLTDLYLDLARNASKPVEQTVRRST